jgi:hypothetical protein
MASPLLWLPWLLLAATLVLWWVSRDTELMYEGFEVEKDGFWSRLKRIHLEDLRKLDRLLQETQNDRDHPYQMTEYEEYFDQLGISKAVE